MMITAIKKRTNLRFYHRNEKSNSNPECYCRKSGFFCKFHLKNLNPLPKTGKGDRFFLRKYKTTGSEIYQSG